jgi:hypothetical protein
VERWCGFNDTHAHLHVQFGTSRYGEAEEWPTLTGHDRSPARCSTRLEDNRRLEASVWHDVSPLVFLSPSAAGEFVLHRIPKHGYCCLTLIRMERSRCSPFASTTLFVMV